MVWLPIAREMSGKVLLFHDFGYKDKEWSCGISASMPPLFLL